MNHIFIAFLFFTLCTCEKSSAQLSIPFEPQPIQLNSFSESKIVLSKPDIQKAKDEDAKSDKLRVGLPIFVDIDPLYNGKWHKTNGTKQIWTLPIHVPDASGLSFCFDNWELPIGARFFVLTKDGKKIAGAYTNNNNNKNKSFTISPVRGEEVILQLELPSLVKPKNLFHLNKIYYIYEKDNATQLLQNPNDPGFLASLSCQINVNCPEGNPVKKQKDGVVRILFTGQTGMFFCSGSLMNNTAKDSTPYILTGYHCEFGIIPLYENFIFYFGWEAPECGQPIIEPGYKTLTGCTLVAHREQSDFTLLKLNNNIPSTYPVCYNGWNKSLTKNPQKGIMVHHPMGDMKKVSIDNVPAVIWNNSVNWSNGITTPAQNHFRVGFDKGTSEAGSSGAPLFDENSRVVGQLNGGSANCQFSTLFIGRLAKSWNDGATPETRLKDWLDPLNLGKDTIGSISVQGSPSVTLSGRITNSKESPLFGVVVSLSGPNPQVVQTDSNGKYTFYNVESNLPLTITPIYNTFPMDGVSTTDLLIVNRFILGQKALGNRQKVAADVTQNNFISALDLLEINRMILGKQFQWPNNTNWMMITPNFIYPNGPGSKIFRSLTTSVDVLNLDFVAVKIGDVTGTID